MVFNKALSVYYELPLGSAVSDDLGVWYVGNSIMYDTYILLFLSMI